MKYTVELLNYDSQWVQYCDAPTRFYALQALSDLRVRGFGHHQTRMISKP